MAPTPPEIALTLVGIASGAPRHLTGEAAAALAEADLILIPYKGTEKADLAGLRHALLETVLEAPPRVVEFHLPVRGQEADYLSSVNAWHDAVARAWAEAIWGALPKGQQPVRIALMVWGDPSLYDSTLRIAKRLPALGFSLRVRVVAGLTSVQLLTASHAIPLNGLGAPVLITTGRRLRQGWPSGVDTLAVMLDGGCAFQGLDPEGIEIWWGAYLGMAEEILRAGALAEIGQEIVALRAEARARHGWIMDTYLLHRSRERG